MGAGCLQDREGDVPVVGELCRFGGLALAHDQIAGMAAAARAQAARQARQRQSPGSAELTDDGDITFSVLEATCPHCDKTVAVLVRHGTALLPLESPQLPA